MEKARFRFVALAAALFLGACSGSSGGGSDSDGSASGVGGVPGTGGLAATGGHGGSGGATGGGGATASGGATGTGGAGSGGGSGTGGGTGKGGATGSGGATSKGGATGSGGATSKGGATGSGGAAGKGGTTGSGGAAGKGGSTGTGDTTGTGGATTVDGGVGCSYQPPSEFIYARWPMPNPASAGLANPASYTDNGDGTVTDDVTKLVWQKSVTSSQAYSWCDAINYCATLTLAGRTWRLPTRIELLSLVDFTRGNPAINTTAFPGVPCGKYHWTSSPWVVSQIATKPQYSWIVNFSEGLTSNAGDRTQAEYARCVSAPDEGPLPSPRYTQVAAGEMQDVDTGLIWATAATTTTTDFTTAQTTCSGLGLNGHTWRTPSIKELSTLVDEVPPISKVSPAIDTTTFAGTAATTPYWSSTLFEGMSATAHDPWVINYEDGFTEYNQTAALVRCVR
jgi:hypothetical protein